MSIKPKGIKDQWKKCQVWHVSKTKQSSHNCDSASWENGCLFLGYLQGKQSVQVLGFPTDNMQIFKTHVIDVD